MKSLFRGFFLLVEDLTWSISCWYNFWLYGPYGLSSTIERMPARFTIKYLRKYGATIGDECRVEKGINIHRPDSIIPFKNLIIGNDVYIGHKAKIDMSEMVIIHDNVIIGARCMFWTHASYYEYPEADRPEYHERKGIIEISEYALIYSGVIVSPGVKIGRYCKIGAASLLNKDAEEYSFYGGVPAKLIYKTNLKHLH